MSVSLTGESAEELASRLLPGWTATAEATKAAAAATAAMTAAVTSAAGAAAGGGGGFSAPRLPQKQYTSAQKMWPGLLAGILAAIALGLCVHTAWSAIRDERATRRARHMSELANLSRAHEPEEKMHYAGGYRDADTSQHAHGGDHAHDGALDPSASVLSSPPNLSPAVTVDNSRRSIHGLI